MPLSLLSTLRHPSWTIPLAAARTLWVDYGHARAARAGLPLDALGQPIPWYTYPAIEYLKQLDFSNKDVFEYGAGYSTLFWAERARTVVSVEDDAKWFETLQPKVPRNCTLMLETDVFAHVHVIDRYPAGFDVIVVDGPSRGHTRLKSCQAAVPHLRRGGMIILDNSDWLPMSAAFLRDSGLIEVDMTGLIPLGGHTQTTSLFLDRAFSIPPRGRQPLPGPGAALKTWESPPPTERPFVSCGGEVFGAVDRDEPFEIATPNGPRRFRAITTRPLADCDQWGAILDLDLGRVLLSINEATAGVAHSVEAEIDLVRGLTWEQFCAFIRNHPKRRYIL